MKILPCTQCSTDGRFLEDQWSMNLTKPLHPPHLHFLKEVTKSHQTQDINQWSWKCGFHSLFQRLAHVSVVGLKNCGLPAVFLLLDVTIMSSAVSSWLCFCWYNHHAWVLQIRSAIVAVTTFRNSHVHKQTTVMILMPAHPFVSA